MSNYYVNILINSLHHAGTEIDPWSLEDLDANTSGLPMGTIIYMKGQRDLSFSFAGGGLGFQNFLNTSNITIDKWGNDPWRLRVDCDYEDSPQPYPILKNGILSLHHILPGDPVYFQLRDYNSQLHIDNMIIIIEDNNINIGIIDGSTIPETVSIRGSTIICNGSIGLVHWGSGNISFIDSIFSCTAITLDGGSSSSDQLINCAFTCNSTGVVTITNCQFNWSAPVWPLWTASKYDWAASTLATGIL
jgi:hypothetical protein